MKNRISLRPNIVQIEQRLFGITDGLIQAVLRGETSEAISAAVRQSAEWAQYQSDMQESFSEPVTYTGESLESVEVPDHIRDLIRRRAAASALSTGRHPEAGQIVVVEKIITPRPGQLEAIMQAPLYVLLDEPSETVAIWRGWLVSGETEYASWWDFVLQEQDQPFDPEAGMVQVWNPVHLYLPMVKRVVGQLSKARLQSVRALAADYLAESEPTDVEPWLGRVASRLTSTGMRVCTGSPLGSSGELRGQYQDIYFKASEAIKQPARLAARELSTVPQSAMGALLNRFISAASRAAEVLLPEPRVPIPMNFRSMSSDVRNRTQSFSNATLGFIANFDPSSDVPDLSWPGTARLRILALKPGGEGRMEVTATGQDSLTAEVKRDSAVEDVAVVAAGDSVEVAWSREDTELLLRTGSGKVLTLNLRDIE